MPARKVEGADTRAEAIREALLDAAISEVVDDPDNSGGEALIERMSSDEATTQSFVVDRRNADTIAVYNQHDGVESNVLISMLSKQLRKRFPRDPSIPQSFWGKLAFKITRPKIEERPKYLCMLHKDSPRRPEIDAAGLQSRFCTKDNMPSEMDAEMHATRKHPQEYKLVQSRLQRIREDEERALRREEVEAMKSLAANRGV